MKMDMCTKWRRVSTLGKAQKFVNVEAEREMRKILYALLLYFCVLKIEEARLYPRTVPYICVCEYAYGDWKEDKLRIWSRECIPKSTKVVAVYIE